MTGLEFKQTLPVIKDCDTDFYRHWRNSKSILDCHSFGRKSVRPYDILVLLKKILPAGSSRLPVYNNIVDKARKQGSLPDDSNAVPEELRGRLTKVIRKTSLLRQDRFDKEFEAF